MIKKIKQQFFALRNGIIADTFRKAGSSYSVIFGLQIPQISEIAVNLLAELPTTERDNLADELWDDKNVRESRLLAPYIYNKESVSMEKALALASETSTSEESDILAFRLLRFLPFRQSLHQQLQQSGNYASQRTSISLGRFL